MATGLENLKIYTLAAELELRVHTLTDSFPRDEKYRSVDQLRRSSSSVANNIAEAYNKRSHKEKIRILSDLVKGEAEETKRNLEMCLRKRFHSDDFLASKYTELLKMVSGYIRFLINRNLQTYQLKAKRNLPTV
ncbi:MAG: four helix bundle protein [Patescibacteria group bacterium]